MRFSDARRTASLVRIRARAALLHQLHDRLEVLAVTMNVSEPRILRRRTRRWMADRHVSGFERTKNSIRTISELQLITESSKQSVANPYLVSVRTAVSLVAASFFSFR